MNKPDVRVECHGTLFTFDLLTDEARVWVEKNVDAPDYMWSGPLRFACEHRYAADIADGMQDAGLVVV